jgi:hypothetical protein
VRYRKAIGLFEGEGCSARRIFRSEQYFRMKSNSWENNCQVCLQAIKKLKEFYLK